MAKPKGNSEDETTRKAREREERWEQDPKTERFPAIKAALDSDEQATQS